MDEKMTSSEGRPRVAVITGGTRGIGFAIAKAMLEDGYRLVLTYARDAGAAGMAVDELRMGGGEVIAVRGDQTVEAEVEAVFEAARTAFGHVDVLVNNAGIASFSPLEEVSRSDYERIFEANVLGPLLVTQAYLRVAEHGGAIINIATVGTGPASPRTGLYTASKAALVMLTRVLANEVASRGIRVNAISPGATETQGFRTKGLAQDARTLKIVSETPLGRIGRPDDIGPVAVFLASEAAKWITGEVITVAGGRH